MNIADFTQPDHVTLGLHVQDKPHLLNELSFRASAFTGIPAGVIFKALQGREQLGSTGIGRGIALPHARIEGLRHLFGMFARLSKKLEFEAVDEQPVDLVFLLLIPAAEGNEHVAALAAISRTLRDAKITEALRAVTSRDETHELLVQGRL